MNGNLICQSKDMHIFFASFHIVYVFAFQNAPVFLEILITWTCFWSSFYFFNQADHLLLFLKIELIISCCRERSFYVDLEMERL